VLCSGCAWVAKLRLEPLMSQMYCVRNIAFKDRSRLLLFQRVSSWQSTISERHAHIVVLF
jgi:hypothetical protein